MTIEYITLGIYFVFLLVIGAVFSKFNRGLGDFVRGGGRGTWWMVGTSMLMAGISAFTFTGNASAAFEAGPSMLVIYLANILGFFAGALFLGRWFRQTRAYTGPDILRARFGVSVEQFSVYLGTLLGPFAAAVQLWALAVFVSSVFGFPLVGTILVIGVITVFYSSSGGLWGVMATDVVQGIILFGITLLMGVLALVEIGGPLRFLQHFNDPAIAGSFRLVKEPGQFPGDKFTWQWLAVIFAMQMIGQIGLGGASKYLSVKDGREASRAAWWAMALMAVGSLVWFLPPMVARFLYVDQVMALGIKDPTTASYAVAAKHLLPNGLMGVMIAAMFSATMSSMDMGMTQQTGAIVRNMIPRLLEWLGRPPLAEKRQLLLCRGINITLGTVIIVLALLLSVQDKFVLFEAFLFVGSIIGIPLAVPLLAGLVCKRLPGWSYFLMIGVTALPAVWSLVQEQHGLPAWTIQERGMWALAFGAAGIALSLCLNRFSSPGHRNREAEFFRRMHTPVDFEREIGHAEIDQAQAVIMSRTLLVLGGLVLLFLLLPNSASARLGILGLALFILTAGSLLHLGARKEMRRIRIGTLRAAAGALQVQGKGMDVREQNPGK